MESTTPCWKCGQIHGTACPPENECYCDGLELEGLASCKYCGRTALTPREVTRMDEEMELGEPDSLKGTFVEEIRNLKAELTKANERIKEAREILSPIFESEKVDLGLRTQVGNAMILLSTPQPPRGNKSG